MLESSAAGGSQPQAEREQFMSERAPLKPKRDLPDSSGGAADLSDLSGCATEIVASAIGTLLASEMG